MAILSIMSSITFGLTNALAVFQHMINNIFREHLDNFVVIYLHDILIYSKNKEGHKKHIWLVFRKLRELGLYAKLESAYYSKQRWSFWGLWRLQKA